MNDKEENEIIVNLALINKNLKDLNEKVDKTSITVYGNGKPDGSIIWVLQDVTTSLRTLTERQATISELLKKLPCRKESCNDITWTTVLKKTIINAPFAVALIIAIILLHDPALATFTALFKLFS